MQLPGKLEQGACREVVGHCFEQLVENTGGCHRASPQSFASAGPSECLQGASAGTKLKKHNKRLRSKRLRDQDYERGVHPEDPNSQE